MTEEFDAKTKMAIFLRECSSRVLYTVKNLQKSDFIKRLFLLKTVT